MQKNAFAYGAYRCSMRSDSIQTTIEETLVWVVTLDVGIKVRFLPKFLVTLVTDVGPFASMHPCMSREVVLTRETASARRTDVGTYPGTNTTMQRQSGRRCEASSTYVTPIWFVAGVSPLVVN